MEKCPERRVSSKKTPEEWDRERHSCGSSGRRQEYLLSRTPCRGSKVSQGEDTQNSFSPLAAVRTLE